jgi:NADPH:quinone reductase
MRAVIIESPSGSLKLTDVQLPEPGPGEVLVKIEAAPLNPSDIFSYRRAPEQGFVPFIPGHEGAGKVVAAGKGILPRLWLGKRVTCSPKNGNGGSWAEYMLTDAGNCFPLGRKVSTEQGALSLVNPLTALGFLEIAEKGRYRTIINNAAASSLGRMLELLCRKNGIALINIVRSAEKADYLRSIGANNVLDSSLPDFKQRLSDLSGKLNARLLFDSVCGENFPVLIEALPKGSTVIIYGNLSPEDHVSIDPRKLLQNDITIRGFYLGNTTKRNGILKNMTNLLKVRSLMSSELKIGIAGRIPLEEAQNAVDAYLSNMSAGKILLIP